LQTPNNNNNQNVRLVGPGRTGFLLESPMNAYKEFDEYQVLIQSRKLEDTEIIRKHRLIHLPQSPQPTKDARPGHCEKNLEIGGTKTNFFQLTSI
jgi:hypothetical protein